MKKLGSVSKKNTIIMYELITNRNDIRNELIETVRCFVTDPQANCSVNFTYVQGENIRIFIVVNFKNYRYSFPSHCESDKIEYSRTDVYICKLSLYRALSEFFAQTLAWGSLTGIRPTRLAARMLNSGVSFIEIAEKLQKNYLVSKEKAELTVEILKAQSKHINDRISLANNGSTERSNLANLYVHIPFCPTRCSYCSFVSEGVEKKSWLLAPYAEALAEEIRRTKELISSQSKRVFSVYVGGGTPTSLEPESLYKVLSVASVDNTEYTCEAGRPDTISKEKLHVMCECGVNRISINPQTLHENTLRRIGRGHTVEQFFAAYELSSKFGFVKNVDLIAGLEGETPEDFEYTLNGILKLMPENITVHTLCLKRGSADAQTETVRTERTQDMINYSVNALKARGYVPYYLYRQKQSTGNLENIGWCRNGFLSVNNVTVMEELLSVYACGAGAIGKLLAPGRIQRIANPKDVLMYLEQFEERMLKKQIFYQNQFTTHA